MQGISLSAPKENKFGELYYEEINGLTFDKQPSEVIFKKWYDYILDGEEALCIIVGMDSGLLPKFFENQTHNDNIKFIFIDYDDVIQTLPELDGEAERWKGDYRIVNQDFNFLRVSEEFRNYVIRRKIMLVKSLSVMDAAPGTPYHELWNQCEVAFSDYRRSEFNALSTKVFEEERIFNAADNVVPAGKMMNTLGDVDIVIVGGGPTLDDSIEWIKQHQDRLIIVAAARIANRLAKESIIPDFFVTVDPFPWSFDNSKGVLAFSDDSILIHSFHAQHKIISQWRGLSAYSGMRYGWKTGEEDDNIGMAGPTVTNSALHIVYSLGATRVYLAGVDFCFARGLSHESGSEEAKVSDTYGYQTKAKVLDNEGNYTETSDDFYSAFVAMKEAMVVYKKARPAFQAISLGLHSAKIEGIPYQHHDQVQLQADDKFDLMMSIREKLTVSKEGRLDHALKTVSFLKEQLRRFSDIQKTVRDGNDVTDKLYNKKTQEPKQKALARVQKLRKKSDKLVGDDGDMLMNYQAVFFADSFKPIEDVNAMEMDEIQEQLHAYFTGLDKVSDEFIAILKKGVKRAQLRADELSDKSLPSKLYQGWEEFEEFGRAVQWQHWHVETQLPEDEQVVLDKALEAFQVEYEKQEHYYSEMVKKKISNVATLLARAHQAFQDKDFVELTGLIKHTEGLPADDENQKESFLNYLKAMRFELLGQTDNAVDHYLLVEAKTFRHQAFKKLLNMYMGQGLYQEALIVLEQLCAYGLDYMVHYADLIALLGQKDIAVNVLEMYLSKESENPVAQTKYIQLLIDTAQKDKAKEFIDSELEKEPTNGVMLAYLKQLG